MAAPTPGRDGPDERTVRAAEIALGLAPRHTAPGLPHDPDLDAAIVQWENDLAGLAGELRPVPPRPAVWDAISAATKPVPAARRVPTAANLNLWRGLAVAGIAVAVLAWVQLRTDPARVPIPQPAAAAPARPLLLSTLRDRDGGAAYVATYDPARAVLIVVPVASALPPGRTARIWLVADGQPPAALASLNGGSSTLIDWATATTVAAGLSVSLVVTLEPTSQPLQSTSDGIVIAHGRFEAL